MPDLSLSEAAIEWGISKRTAYRLAEEGRIHVARFGRRATVPAEEVERGWRPCFLRGSRSAAHSRRLALPRRGRPRGEK